MELSEAAVVPDVAPSGLTPEDLDPLSGLAIQGRPNAAMAATLWGGHRRIEQSTPWGIVFATMT